MYILHTTNREQTKWSEGTSSKTHIEERENEKKIVIGVKCVALKRKEKAVYVLTLRAWQQHKNQIKVDN